MRAWILILLAMLTSLVFAQAVSRISYFADPFGNTGSFWKVSFEGRDYRVLKIKSSDKPGEADFAFENGEALTEFETRAGQLYRGRNPLKKDGFQVVWSREFGDATLRTVFARLNGINVKLIQVTQIKEHEGKFEHQLALDQCYSEFAAALKKARKAP